MLWSIITSEKGFTYVYILLYVVVFQRKTSFIARETDKDNNEKLDKHFISDRLCPHSQAGEKTIDFAPSGLLASEI